MEMFCVKSVRPELVSCSGVLNRHWHYSSTKKAIAPIPQGNCFDTKAVCPYEHKAPLIQPPIDPGAQTPPDAFLVFC